MGTNPPAKNREFRVGGTSERDIAVLGFGKEDQRKDKAKRAGGYGIPKTGIDVAGRNLDGERRRRHEAAEPARANMVGEREAAIANTRRKEFNERRRHRSVKRGRADEEDKKHSEQLLEIDARGVGFGGIPCCSQRSGDLRLNCGARFAPGITWALDLSRRELLPP